MGDVMAAEYVRQPSNQQIPGRSAKQGHAQELALIERLLSACLKEQGKQSKNVAHLAAGLLAYMQGAFQLVSAAPDAMPVGYADETAFRLMQRFIDAEPDAPNRARSRA